MAAHPPPKPPDTSVIELFATELASVLNAMTGEQPGWEASAPEPAPASGRHVGWQQTFSDPSFGPAWVWTPYEAAVEIGNRMLRAAGVTDEDEAGAADTYLEIVRQALSSFARVLSARACKEIACIDGAERQTPSDANHIRLQLKFPDGGAAHCYVYFPAQLPQEKALRAATAPPEEEAVASTLERSKTLDLLLDVELPVSISFGRTRMALKDVVKLTTGCIIELERSVGQPVDIIVNDRVIARGEVVVVDGNFGVRIQEVASRQDRIRTVA